MLYIVKLILHGTYYDQDEKAWVSIERTAIGELTSQLLIKDTLNTIAKQHLLLMNKNKIKCPEVWKQEDHIQRFEQNMIILLATKIDNVRDLFKKLEELYPNSCICSVEYTEYRHPIDRYIDNPLLKGGETAEHQRRLIATFENI